MTRIGIFHQLEEDDNELLQLSEKNWQRFFSFFLIDSVSVHFMFAAYKYSGRKN